MKPLAFHKLNIKAKRYIDNCQNNDIKYEGVFLKPNYGDASGVRGAARKGRSATYKNTSKNKKII